MIATQKYVSKRKSSNSAKSAGIQRKPNDNIVLQMQKTIGNQRTAKYLRSSLSQKIIRNSVSGDKGNWCTSKQWISSLANQTSLPFESTPLQFIWSQSNNAELSNLSENELTQRGTVKRGGQTWAHIQYKGEGGSTVGIICPFDLDLSTVREGLAAAMEVGDVLEWEPLKGVEGEMIT